MKLKIIFSALLLTSFLSLKGQIIYTDFIPDIYLTNQPLGTLDTTAIDINQDAIADFTARCETYFYSVHQGCCWNTDNRIHINPAEISFAWNNVNAQSICGRMELDTNIWIDSSFYYPTTNTEAYFYRAGNFAQCGWSLDTIQKFYPFRKTISSDTLYGWIRIEAHPTFMIIYDATINLTPNVGLYSGQTTTEITEINATVSVELRPNPFTNELSVTVNNNQISEIILYDIASRKILQQEFTNSISLNTEQLTKGLYLYKVRSRNGLYKKGKVVKD